MEAPTDKKGVERLLGTVNYVGKFITNLGTITKPIRSLLKKEIEFQWSFEQQKAFQDIKDTLTKDEGPVLKFFDVSKPVTISCDASPTGLGLIAKEMIANKSLPLAPPRLQRLLLRIRKYNYTIVYKSAKELMVLPYRNIRDELSVIDGIILKGDRIFVPLAMRKEMLKRIHHGHMGIEKSKRRARDALYWPLMSNR
jgi:hypothetical protein